MKRALKFFSMALIVGASMTSCYSHKFIIGDGPKTGVQIQAKNHFFILGLVPGKTSDPQALVGDAKDYEITEVQTFVDGLLGVITFGIYTPTTTKIQK